MQRWTAGMIHRTPAERSNYFQLRTAGCIFGLFAVTYSHYYFGGSFLIYLPFYVLVVFGMLATLLAELLEILLYEIKSLKGDEPFFEKWHGRKE
jgi:hypothetical protein